MNEEVLEYLKFLHIHNLINVIKIIESIPIYYHTQIRRFITKELHDMESGVFIEKMRLQNLTFIAKYGHNFFFPNLNIEFQTFRVGHYSHDIENELQNLTNSNVFNNAISLRKTHEGKRYIINSYDKEWIVKMFRGADNYRNFLEIVTDKDLNTLHDISYVVSFHNRFANSNNAKIKSFYEENDQNKRQLLVPSLIGLVSWKKDYNTYINSLVTTVINLQKLRNLQSPVF